ncbi:hypothetical protein AB6A40_005243 [Gnathostoma spinigerum]|uniref:Protein kinase domain-containing protein n=1 Tax=Gnathostoma spinigerum TaxID=75299 RepID=A0ABD6EK51_9BILA
MFWFVTLYIVCFLHSRGDAEWGSCKKQGFGGVMCTNLKDLTVIPDDVSSEIRTLYVKCGGQSPATGHPDVKPLKDCKMSSHNGNLLGVSVLSRFRGVRRMALMNCAIQGVEHFAFEFNDALEVADLSGNCLKVVEWQAVAHALRLRSLILTNNPLQCDCANRWMSELTSEEWSFGEVFHLPAEIMRTTVIRECNFSSCDQITIEARNTNVTTEIGKPLELACDISGIDALGGSRFPNFEWVFSELKIPTESMSVRGRSLLLSIPQTSSKHLGIILCKCWQCQVPLFRAIQVRLLTPISVRFTNLLPYELIIYGYPLLNLNLTLHSNGLSESNLLDDSEITFFDNILLVRFEKTHSQFFVRYYSFSYQPCHNCSSEKNITLHVCSAHSCAYCNGSLQTLMHRQVRNQQQIPATGLEERRTFSTLLTITLLGFPLFVVTVMLILAWKFELYETLRKHRKRKSSDGTNIPLESDTSDYPNDPHSVPLIDRESINLDKKIGQGAFSEVFSADWKGSPSGRVAVKFLKDVEIDAEMDREAHLLSQLEHPNVVRLYGIAKERKQVLLIMELITLGNLKSYLRDRVPTTSGYSHFPPALTTSELLDISIQICQGLCYLNSQQIVHRDIATRNCLVSGETDILFCDHSQRPPFTVKISDFGMSRRLYSQTEYYRMNSLKAILPVRWMPPESVQFGKFTHASDIWAFGITLWEVCTYGDVPFGELSNAEILSAVASGVRLPKPKHTPGGVHEIMQHCWELEPNDRPSCYDVLDRLLRCRC